MKKLVAFLLCFSMLFAFCDNFKTNVIAEGSKYIVIMGFTYCIYTFTTLMLGMLRSVETVKIGFVVTAISLVVNIILNYALIFGNFGCPELGVEGAAYATLIARCVEFLIVFVYKKSFKQRKIIKE